MWERGFSLCGRSAAIGEFTNARATRRRAPDQKLRVLRYPEVWPGEDI